LIISQELSVADAAARLHGARTHPQSQRASMTAIAEDEDLRAVVAFAKIALDKWGEEMERDRELELRRRNAFLEEQRAMLERELAGITGLLGTCSSNTAWWMV
jgi:hypothetical protein